jgi:hypothetical protein
LIKIGVLDSCLTPISGTGGGGASDLVVCEVVQDDDTSLVDCLERVSCAKVSALVIIIICTYVYLLLLGATLGEVSEYSTSHACCGPRSDYYLTTSGA